MMNRLRNLLRPSRTRKESGNTLVVVMMMLPVIVSVFGLSLDLSIAKFVERSLDTNMTASLQGALSQAKTTNSNVPIIASDGSEVKRLYAINTGRSDSNMVPFLMCQQQALKVKGAKGSKLVTPPAAKGCGWTEPLMAGQSSSFTYSNSNRVLNVTYTVVEASDTIFLQFLGIDELQHIVSGGSSTSWSHEQL